MADNVYSNRILNFNEFISFGVNEKEGLTKQ